MNKSYLIVFVIILLSSILLYDYISYLNDEILYYKDVNKIQGENINNLIKEKIFLEEQLNIKELRYNNTSESLRICQNEKENQMNMNEKLMEQKGVNMNPTLYGIKEFLRKDKTDENKWTDDFDCTEFSNTLISNMINEGKMFACTTELEFGDSRGHIIVAVNTSDYDLLYIEPQTDRIIVGSDLRVGINYCDVVGWKCNWNITSISSCFEHRP